MNDMPEEKKAYVKRPFVQLDPFLRKTMPVITVASAALFVLLTVVAVCIAASRISEDREMRERLLENRSVNITFASVTEKVTVPKDSTVKEALETLGIHPDENDIINYPAERSVSEGMNIKYTKVYTDTLTYVESIPYNTKRIEVQTIPKGTVEIQREGHNGTLVKYVEAEYRDGKFYSENEIRRQTVEQPVDEIVHVGVGGSFVGHDGRTYDYSYYIDMVATAYYGLGPYVKSGKLVALGMIAVDPDVIPLGTKVYLTGEYKDYGVVSCEDTGGFIKGKRIDIYMATLEDCCDFGRRDMRVYILEDQEKYPDEEIFTYLDRETEQDTGENTATETADEVIS